MLNPDNNRLDYGQILTPPEDYELNFAVCTTYSLDLNALIGACLALGASEETDSGASESPVQTLNALRKVSGKLALFCEGGQIKAPTSPSPLFVLLEKSVEQVNKVKSDNRKRKFASFHPKFWLIKYTVNGKNPIYRVIVLSRNLTFDRSWDVVFSMNGTKQAASSIQNNSICEFLQYLLSHSTDAAKKKQIKMLIDELPFVNFDLEDNQFKEIKFLPIGIGNGAISENDDFKPLLNENFEEVLIMSPFLSGKTIEGFAKRASVSEGSKYMLFTRDMSLAQIKNSNIDPFKIYVLDDKCLNTEEDNPDIYEQDIHAKIFLIKNSRNTYLYLGSLNASENGQYGNVEFMVRLTVNNRIKDKLSVESLSKEFFRLKNPGEPGCPFVEKHITGEEIEDKAQDITNELNQIIKAINRSNASAEIIEKLDGYDIKLHLQDIQDIVKKGYTVTISPLLSNQFKNYSREIVFEALPLAHLSHFYVVSVAGDGECVKRVIIIKTKGIPENRDNEIVSSVIKNKDGFYRYVAFLLDDQQFIDTGESSSFERGEGEHAANIFQSVALYEKMLYIAAIKPERLVEVGRLITVLEGKNIVPNEFKELFEKFKKVVKIHG